MVEVSPKRILSTPIISMAMVVAIVILQARAISYLQARTIMNRLTIIKTWLKVRYKIRVAIKTQIRMDRV